MRKVVEKLVKREKLIARRKGEFELFALSLREGSSDQWDILVAAPWLRKDKYKELTYLAGEVQKALLPEELVHVSQIVILDDKHPALKAFRSAFNSRHGIVELRDCNLFGLQVKHVFLVTSQTLPAAKKKTVKKKSKRKAKKKAKK